MKKTHIILLATVAMLMLLVGCGHEHDFQPVSCDAPLTCTICGKTQGDAVGHDYAEATCTEPKTCVRCGITEGEALGHDYAEATCTEPKTCKRCGDKQGEALGHKLSEANYQDAPTCSACGATEGNPLTAGFEEHGLKINAEFDKDIPYITDTYENSKLQTTATVRYTDFKVFKGDDRLPEKDGYIWISVHADVDYTDDAAWDYGYMTGECIEDYYDIEGHDKSVVYYEKKDIPEEYKDFSDNMTYTTYTVNFHGKDYDCERLYAADEGNGWIAEKHARYGCTYCFHIPEGYDGTVLGFYHKKLDHPWEEGMYIYDMADEDTIFIRLDPELAGRV